MSENKDIWKIYEARIDDLVIDENISLDDVSELFKIGHEYNRQRKLIPEKLSNWMKSRSDYLRSKSISLYKKIGIEIPVSRPTDAYAMSMVVSDVWGEVFSEKPTDEIFSNIGAKYDVSPDTILQNFIKYWSAGLDYHLVLRMKELSPFEMGLVATYVSPIVKKNKSESDKIN